MNSLPPDTNPERCYPHLTPRRVSSGLLLFAAILLLAQSALAAVTFRAATQASASTPSTIIQFRGVGSLATGASGNVTPNYPSGWQANDILLCLVETKDNVTTTMPSGWTQYLSGTNGAAHQAKVFWKKAVTGDSTSPTVTHSGGNSIIARIIGFYNVDTTNPFEGTASLTPSASDLTTEALGITTASQGAMLVFTAHIADNNSSIDNANMVAGWSELFASATSKGSDSSIEAWFSTPTTVGSQPAITAPRTGTAAISSGGMIALKPATPGFPSLAMSIPPGTTSGDVMVTSITVTPSTTSITPPSGWTVVQDILQPQAASSHLITYYRIATSSEPTSYTWSFPSSHSGAVGGIATFSGVDTSNPIGSSASLVENGKNAVNHTAPSITASTDDMLVTVHEYQSSGTWTPPGGMTEVVDKYSEAATDANGVSLEMNYLLLTSTGATGTKVATASNNGDEGASQSLALKSIPLTCYNDNFNGTLASNWVMANETGTFGNPRIVNQRLRLTDASTGVSTMAALQQLFPAANNKIIVEFDHLSYNGSGADGMCVVLSDASIAPVPGAFGGSLGYAPKQVSAGGDTTHAGFAGGWIGVALDEYGNFSNPTEGRTGGPGFRPDSASVRGSGSLYTGYTYIAGTTTLSPGIDNAGSTTPAPGYRYRITIDHTDGIHAYTSVERDTTGTGNSYTTLVSPFDAKAAAGQAAVPANWFLSFTGSTGASVNIHEFDNLRVCSTQPQPLPTLNHVRLLHDGCAPINIPKTITLKACADTNCSVLYLGPVTVDLTNIAGVTWSSDPITFSGGQTTVTLTKTTTDTVTIGGTITSPAATNTTAICYNGATQTCMLSSSCFDAVEVTKAASTPIYTKLSGTAFSLDVLGLATGFTGPVSVALVDPTAASGNCSDFNTGLTAEAAYTFLTGDNGRRTFNFSYPYAAKNVKVRIRNTTTNLSVCSSDNFAIRPLLLTLSTTTPLAPASNTLTAGANFNLTANSGISAGYTGTPTNDLAKIVDHNNAAIEAGVLTGAFTAATGVSAAGTFQYLDVGTITLNTNAVFDSSFTAVDQVRGLVNGVDHGANGDCASNSFSNTLTGGLYGCNIGGTALGPLGRFVPHHFTVVGAIANACTVGNFTYMNQPFMLSRSGDPSKAEIVEARNSSDTVTKKYSGAYGPGVVSYGAENNDNGINLSARLALSGSWVNGVYTLTGNITTATFNRPVTATPDATWGPFDSLDLGLTVTDINVTTSPKVSGADMNPSVAGGTNFAYKKFSGSPLRMRYGRLRLPNAYGPETAAVIMALRTEYYNGTGFATNTLDNCTSLNLATDLQLNTGSGWVAGNTTMPIGSGTTKATLANSPFVNGQAGLSFSAPGAGNIGYVDVQIPTMSSVPWLQYDWDNNGSLDPSLNARVNFGIYRGNDRIINWREIIR